MSETRHTVDPKFVFQRQGKDVVLYQGLLDAAHRAGLAGISTEILQYPSDTNGQTTFARAVVAMENGGRFTGIADANPGNVGKNIAPHAPRMAETRAKARALRDALNVGMVTVEELGGNDDADDYAGSQAPYQKDGGDIRPNRAPQPAQRPQANGSAPTRAPQPPTPQRPPQQATAVELAPNQVKIPCTECRHAPSCRTEGYCQAAAVRVSKAHATGLDDVNLLARIKDDNAQPDFRLKALNAYFLRADTHESLGARLRKVNGCGIPVSDPQRAFKYHDERLAAPIAPLHEVF